MNLITINEPVWNGGKPYFSIRDDRVRDKNIFVRCSHLSRQGNATYPNTFYVDGDALRQTKTYTERWGTAYRVFPKELPTLLFYVTIAWSKDGEDFEETYVRSCYDDIKETVGEFFDKFPMRKPYVECCASESSDGKYKVDLTESIKHDMRK